MTGLSITFLILSSVVSTTLMTLFSYGVSEMRNEQFREPELLNTLINRLNRVSQVGRNHPLGWILHYGVGFIFLVIIEWFPTAIGINTRGVYYVMAGMICGMVGVAVWHLAFILHPNAPKINFRNFYIQLIGAHIVFGLGAWLSKGLATIFFR